MEYFKVGEGSV